MKTAELWFKYKSACEVEGQKLEYVSKLALEELLAEHDKEKDDNIKQAIDAEIKNCGDWQIIRALTELKQKLEQK